MKKKNKSKAKANTDDVQVKSEPIEDGFLDSDDEGDGGGELGDGMEFRKKVEEGMRQWAEALTCRRDVANGYFNNPPPTSGKYFFVRSEHPKLTSHRTYSTMLRPLRACKGRL